MAGSDLGDDHKTFFAGDNTLDFNLLSMNAIYPMFYYSCKFNQYQ